MHKADQYRDYAAAAMRLAASAKDERERNLMLEVAQGWLDLSERQARNRWTSREPWTKPADDEKGQRHLN